LIGFGGGGVGLYGEGTSAPKATITNINGGSGGTNGGTSQPNGGHYGAGGGAGNGTSTVGGKGSGGAVRIVYRASASFPSTNVGFEADGNGEGGLVWIKCRTEAFNHLLYDTERGAGKALLSDTTSSEGAENLEQLSSFNSNGFSVGPNLNVNMIDKDYASWTFRKAPSFFDVVTYTGDGVKGREIPHNLGVKPGMIIVKCSSASADWMVWHAESPASSQGEPYMGILNSTDPINNTYNRSRAQVYEVTDANFKVLGTANNPIETNLIGNEYVAYVFAHDDSDESLIKCGSFTDVENSGASSQHIELGFEPQFILMKTTSRESGWYMWDTMRGMSEPQSKYLLANDSVAESYIDSPSAVYPTPTGFYMPGFWGAGEDVIYMAIRRPNKPAEEFEPEELFHVDTTLADRAPTCRTPFVSDMGFVKKADEVGDISLGSRLTQGGFLKTHESNAEQASSPWQWDHMDGWLDFLSADSTHWSWRRAPGFFDVVAYEGDRVRGREVPHNLGVVPEMMWIKRRSGDYNWGVWHKDVSPTSPHYELVLNNDEKVTDANNSNTAFYAVPTSNDFFLTEGSMGNRTGDDYIAYLFASVPGISKVGSYTGTGGEQPISCGFPVRFVLIKRTDASGDWMYFDTLRGISSTDSPMLKLNEASSQVAGSYIAPRSIGFRAKTEETNKLGATYIYYAIA
jgi:hypothetical protein